MEKSDIVTSRRSGLNWGVGGIAHTYHWIDIDRFHVGEDTAGGMPYIDAPPVVF